ncbi:MAG: secretin and TonB N-terminal domain-containing protein [Planctomycetes bacterium]|nr:secretin and TonB N-terminal domain-containing protein [Planctomycetota bacterium]
MNGTTTYIGRAMATLMLSICVICTLFAGSAYGQQDEGVNVTDVGTIDLAVQDTDLAQVLQMLSMQTKKNIIASRNVSGTVTANLYNVTFHQALESILRSNGLRYIEEGNFIYVYTQSEYDEIQASSLRTESRLYDLNYLSAEDGRMLVTPLLSASGQVAALGTVEAGYQPGIEDGGADSYAYNARLVINDYPKVLDDISDLLKKADTPPQQVLVEATILQTKLTEDNAFGIDFSVIGGFDFSDLASPLNVVAGLTGTLAATANPITGLQSTVGGTTADATFKVGLLSNDVSAFLRLLDDVTDTTVLARPKILALNRQRAQVLVGERVGYLSTTATQTTTTQTVEYLDTGVQLIFRPFISTDGTIRMELAPSVSEFTLRQVSDQGGNLVTIPDEDTNEITTNVRVRDGKTIVLGGLFKESTTISRKQVPFFGDIPLIGAAFRGQEDTLVRSEITFLITPTIVSDAALFRMGEDMLAHAHRAVVGARNGLLPFSRTFITTNYNLDAIASFNEGDTERALFFINNSLRMNPSQQDMIQLRQKVTGDRLEYYERSNMERVIRKELGSLISNHDLASVMRDWSDSDQAPGAPTLSEFRTIDDFFSGSQNPFFLPSMSSANDN